MWSCRGTLRLVTSAPHPRFAFGKASVAVTLVGRLKCLDCLPPHILLSLPSWSSSRCSVTATSTLPSSHRLSWHLTASRWHSIFRLLYNNPPRLRPSFWPLLIPFCSPSRFFADVTKGSPLLPACFFPFYFLRMEKYVRRIWLGDRRDVRLDSYQRDLGVWMFPGVRRTRFLLAIALKLNAVFVPFFSLFFLFSFFSFFESCDY